MCRTMHPVIAVRFKGGWRAVLITVCIAALLLAAAPAAGASGWHGGWRQRDAYLSSEGRGGSWVGVFRPDLGDLNSKLQANGFGTLEGTMLLFGGGGYGAWETWRIGGIGGGGAVASQSGTKRAELSMGFGAVQVARVWPMDGTQLELGLLLGGGGASLVLSHAAPASSDDAIANPHDTVIDQGFFLVGPSVGARIDLTRHIGLELSAGYLFTFGDWEHRGSETQIGGLPGLDGAFISVGVTFGGYGARRR